MSKLLNIYNSLKKTDYSSLYLFKSGMFYIFLDQDAQIVHNLLNLKLTHLTPTIVKCGFPINSLDKYLNLLTNMNCTVKVIDTSTDTIYSVNDYVIDSKTASLLKEISKVDINNLSISEAYSFIENIKRAAIEITSQTKE